MNNENTNHHEESKKISQDEDEAYQGYLERISSPPCPVKLTAEQIEELQKQGYKID